MRYLFKNESFIKQLLDHKKPDEFHLVEVGNTLPYIIMKYGKVSIDVYDYGIYVGNSMKSLEQILRMI